MPPGSGKSRVLATVAYILTTFFRSRMKKIYILYSSNILRDSDDGIWHRLGKLQGLEVIRKLHQDAKEIPK